MSELAAVPDNVVSLVIDLSDIFKVTAYQGSNESNLFKRVRRNAQFWKVVAVELRSPSFTKHPLPGQLSS